MRRVSIAEIMEETGLSRATVDRVLNARGKVHERTRQVVEQTILRLQMPQDQNAVPTPQADIVLRLGRGMMSHMKQAWEKAGARGAFHEMYNAQEDTIVSAVAKACENPERPLIITAMNGDRLNDVLREARSRGKRVVTLISDLAPEARDVHVGIDDRAAGQTAAFLVGRTLGDRPTTVGVVVGEAAFRNHELREMGFRTGLRAHFPRVAVAGEAHGGDSGEMTGQAVAKLLRDQPALGAIYNVGGGNAGIAKALADSGRNKDVLVICHEVNSVTAPLMRQGAIDFAIATRPALLLGEALAQLEPKPLETARDAVLLDFEVYTRFNLPDFADSARA